MIKIVKNTNLNRTFGELAIGETFLYKRDTEETELYMKIEVNELRNTVCLSDGQLVWFDNVEPVIPVDAVLTYEYR